MINVNELRIGNWIKADSVGITQIIELRHDCCGIDGGDLPYKDFYEKIEPVPITSEILLSYGFEKNESYNNIFHKGKWRVWLKPKGNKFYKAGDQIRGISYVHELQNLYFALTGKELEINLTEGTK